MTRTELACRIVVLCAQISKIDSTDGTAAACTMAATEAKRIADSVYIEGVTE